MSISTNSAPTSQSAWTSHSSNYLPHTPVWMWENGKMGKKKKEQSAENVSFRREAVPVSEAKSSRRLRRTPKRPCCP
jgi:hypothetical protein